MIRFNNIEAFYGKAKQFCYEVRDISIDRSNAGYLMFLLMGLYIDGLFLPEKATRHTDSASEINGPNRLPVSITVENDLYWEMFDPIACIGGRDAPVCCSLTDDIKDICMDLQAGSLCYEAGRVSNAVHIWKTSLDFHFGQHIVDILRVLHKIRTS